MRTSIISVLTSRIIIFALIVFMAGSVYSGTFKEDYNLAYESYESVEHSGNKTEIERVGQIFITLSTRNDAGRYESNCHFWAGQCYYLLNKHAVALQLFEKASQDPDSYKFEDARFKLARCYIRLGWNDSAIWEMNRFMDDFPYSRNMHKVHYDYNRVKRLIGK